MRKLVVGKAVKQDKNIVLSVRGKLLLNGHFYCAEMSAVWLYCFLKKQNVRVPKRLDALMESHFAWNRAMVCKNENYALVLRSLRRNLQGVAKRFRHVEEITVEKTIIHLYKTERSPVSHRIETKQATEETVVEGTFTCDVLRAEAIGYLEKKEMWFGDVPRKKLLLLLREAVLREGNCSEEEYIDAVTERMLKINNSTFVERLNKETEQKEAEQKKRKQTRKLNAHYFVHKQRTGKNMKQLQRQEKIKQQQEAKQCLACAKDAFNTFWKNRKTL